MNDKETMKSSSKQFSLEEVKEIISFAISKNLVSFEWDGLKFISGAQYGDVPIDKSLIQSSSAKDLTNMTDEDYLMMNCKQY